MPLLNNDFHLPFPILIGDIGGTNARFSYLLEKDTPHYFSDQVTKHFRNIDQAIEEVIWPEMSVKPKSLILALAAPIEKNVTTLTNCHWSINPQFLIQKFGLDYVFLINDFEAQALATVALETEHLYKIEANKLFLEKLDNHSNPKKNKETRLILGPGTGLGVTALLSANQRYIPVPGEGGHIDYAPQNEFDMNLYPYLLGDKSRLSAEELLSGRGLLNIYKSFCQYHHQIARYESPDLVTDAAKNGDAIAFKALNFFIDYLARFSGDLALVFKAEGGVYIGGGIMPQLIDVLNKIRFRTFFENKFPHQKILTKIPIYVILHQKAALLGIEHLIRYPFEFLIGNERHLWKR